MERIASFCVDHTKLDRGMYLSRQDGDVLTWDIRMKRPNHGDYLSTGAAHTLEHLFATYARNSAFQDSVIYVGPMGCRTGFYLLTRGLTPAQALALTVDSFRFMAAFEGDIPGASEVECGNYRDMDLSAAKAEAAVTLPPRRKEYLIVDGYNMIFAWDGLREQAGYDLSGARERLLDLLSNYCGFHPCELIVVFDSYRVRGGTGSRSSHNNLRVVYTQEDESADLYIETLVGKIGRNYAVRVATSDALIQLSALRSGVLRVSAAELERELERTNGEIAAVLRRLREEARHAAGQESPLRALDPKSNPDKEEPI